MKLVAALAAVVVLLVGCGGGSKAAPKPPAAITVHGRVTIAVNFFSVMPGECSGVDADQDLDTGLSVVVRNDDGKFLGRSTLGRGVEKTSPDHICVLPFAVRLSAGQAHYVVTVGHRPDVAFTWQQVKTPGRVLIDLT